jgi:hypothetical protein
MASGHVHRIKRPNTWLQRPMLQNREESSCQTGAVHTWHLADITRRAADVGCSGDCVAKVENRTALKISRKLIFRLLCCCVAFQRHYGDP